MTDAKTAARRKPALRTLPMSTCLLILLARFPASAADGPVPATSDVRLLVGLKGTDLDGTLHRISDAPEIRGAAVVFLSTTCPISNGYLPQLQKLAGQCHSRGVEFYGIVSDPAVTRVEALQHRDDFHIRFPLLFDVSGALRRRLGATHSPHAFVISRSGDQLYAGRIDDLYSEVGRRRNSATVHDLKSAIDALVSGKPVATPVTTPVGCLLEQSPTAAVAGSVTFNRDIAPILYANCSECHRPGQTAPFPLLSYDDAVRHARQIAAVTQSRFMPPWHPVAGFGHFQNERRLTDAEVELIQCWAADGLPEGDSADRLAPPHFNDGWRLGKPDLILTMKDAFEVQADGDDVHQHFVLPTGLTKHRLVSAVEFRPGNPRVTHHASFYVDTTGTARQLQLHSPDVGYGSFVGPGFPNVSTLRSWLPGMSPQHLPDGTGQLLHANSDLVFEVHYRRSGKVESDRSSIGIHFARSTARQVVGEFQVMNKELTIPAGAARHRHTASFTLPVEAILLDTVPHMHLLGREIKAVAVQPDGEVVPLVWVKNWDFNWQGQYLYAEPLHLPKGTRIDLDAWYDNSTANPLNPHAPPKTVCWGEQTQEEMGICQFRYTCRTMEEFAAVNLHYVRYAAEQQQQFNRLQSSAD